MSNEWTHIFTHMPDFNNHEEVRTWLKSQFGEQISLKTSAVIDGKRIFYYHLIKDPLVYEEYMETLNQKADIISAEPFKSYSTIEISEDGGISFSI